MYDWKSFVRLTNDLPWPAQSVGQGLEGVSSNQFIEKLWTYFTPKHDKLDQ